MTNDDPKVAAAAYVPWKTFTSSLDALENGVPHQIDRTVFPGMAWSVQNQLFLAFRFLGLTDEAGVPTPTLRDLTTASQERAAEIMMEILKEKYAAVFELGLENATFNQLTNKLGEAYGVSGDTRTKAVRFFLSAAKFAGVKLSNYITNAKTGVGRPKVRKANGHRPPAFTVKLADDEVIEDDEEETPAPGTSKTVTLRSGGALTLSATLDMFSLGPEDREFVFGLIDRLKEYEAKTPHD